MAGLIVHLLHQAGVVAGDTIAVGSSASFPALMIATLAAAQAMEVYPVVILSLSASSYGGTKVDFNLLSIYQLLLREGVFTIQPTAISLGGEKDIGQDVKPDIKERLLQQIQRSGISLIYEPDLQKNVAARMKIYLDNSSASRIAAFINIGGNYANLGTSALVLDIKPGLNRDVSLPAKSERGVLFEMAAQDIPCIHLLFIKGLAMKYGLPWDPIPLPEPGASELLIN
jgi:poly-gamma-glutamate system protein